MMNRRIFLTSDFIVATLFLLVLTSILFVGNQMMNGTIVAKTFVFFVAVNFCIIYLIVKMMKVKTAINIIDIALIIYVLYIFIRVCIDKEASMYNHKLIEWGGLLVFYFFIRETINYKSDRIYIYLFLLVSIGLIEILWGILQLYGILPSYNIDFHLTGSFFNPGPYASFLSIIFPIALACILFFKKNEEEKNKIYLRKLSFVYIIIFITVIPSTHSRISWISVGICTILLISYRYKLYSYYKTLLWYKQAIFLLTAAIIIIVMTHFLYIYKAQSANGRIFIWKNTISCIKHKPIFGNGFDRFAYFYNIEQANYFSNNNGTSNEIENADFTDYAFNDYLQIPAETGVVGLILFIGIIILALWYIEISNWIIISLKIALLAFLVISCTSYSLSILPLKILLVFLLALLSCHKKEIFRIKKAIPLLYFIVIFNFSNYIIVKQFRAYKSWKDAYTFMMQGGHEIACKLYEKCYPALKNSGEFLQCYAKGLSLSKKYKESNVIIEEAKRIYTHPILYNTLGVNYYKMDMPSLAEKNIIIADNIIPGRLYSKFLLANIYFETKQNGKFEELADKILLMDIKVNNLASEQIISEVKKMKEKIK